MDHGLRASRKFVWASAPNERDDPSVRVGDPARACDPRCYPTRAAAATVARMRLGAIVPLLLATGGWWVVPSESPDQAIVHASLVPGIAEAEAADVRSEPAPVASVATNVGATTVAALGPVDPVEESAAPSHAAALVPTTAIDDELAEVRWSIERDMRFNEVALHWGMWPDDLRELNPEHAKTEVFPAGTALVVHRADPHEPTMSIGAPNRGRLKAGIPLPEGEHWRLREFRPRGFGAKHTISALLTAFRSYGETHPDGPQIRIGEISRRTGGRVKPHVSHRSGRDVDIGYVLHKSVRDTQHWWRAATADNIDAKRTWELIESLIATGEVQQIFMSAKLQRLIAAEAAKQLPPEQVASIFSATNPDPSVHTIVRHEHGHRDHFHVRFDCEDGNVRCRRESRQ
jgi:murein endopeptidase